MTTPATRHLPAPRRIDVPGEGAEDVVVDEDGHVWTGTADGSILRIAPDGSARTVGGTGGRPLGLELLDADRLLVCDAEKGLLAFHRRTGVVERLATEVEGTPIRVCNNAAVGSAGDIWFTDSSAVHPLRHWRRDLLEHTRTGRLLHRRPDGMVEVVLRGLAFANGVALGGDEAFVCVAESGGRALHRVHLHGARAGEHDLLVADLPGYPDNLSRGSDGLIWAPIASPRMTALEVAHRLPRPLRRVLSHVPRRLQPQVPRTVRVQAYDDDGRLVHDLEADASTYHMVTGAREHRGDLWLGSVEEPAVAVLPGVLL